MNAVEAPLFVLFFSLHLTPGLYFCFPQGFGAGHLIEGPQL